MRFLVSVSLVALIAAFPAAVLAQVPGGASAPVIAPAAPPADAPADDPFATPPAIGSTPGTAATVSAAEERDPLEKFNRAVWGLNQGIDKVVLKPAATVYRAITPRPLRRGIGHVFSNLSEPWSFINNVLQLKFKRAAKNLGRFVVNTTIGVGGLADQATKLGIKPAPEDFGQTLARYGAKHSPYLVLPLFGPSTVRDGIGTGVGYFADPYPICLKQCTNLSWVERTGIQAVEVVDTRSQLIDSGADAFLQASLDPYATARSAYLQRRAIELVDGEGADGTEVKPGNVDPTTPPPATPATPGDAADPFATPPANPGAASAPAPGSSADPFATPAEPATPRPSAALLPADAPKLAVVMSEGMYE